MDSIHETANTKAYALKTMEKGIEKTIDKARQICYNAYEIGDATHNKKRDFK